MIDENGLKKLMDDPDLYRPDIMEIQRYFRAKDRFKVGPYFIAVLDDEEVHQARGTNYNIKRGWDVGGATLIFLSSRLGQRERNEILAHEIDEDLEYVLNIPGGFDEAHKKAKGNDLGLPEVLKKLERVQKQIGHK